MNKIEFAKEAREALTASLTALKEQSHLKGMEDLNKTVIQFETIVKEFSKGKLGIGLPPSQKQTHPVLDHHRFYILSVVSEDRKKLIAPLDLLAVATDGQYPVYFLTNTQEELAYGLGDLAALEGRFIQHCYGEALVKAIETAAKS